METFIVRVWSQSPSESGASSGGSAPRSMRGVVRHVGRGTETTFSGPDELVELLSAPAGLAPRRNDSGVATGGNERGMGTNER
jgi:hypothetical protein